MILVAIDDLMFASKISSAARQLGVEVVFAKSADEVLAQARALRPRLVIFDLNSHRTDPLATLAGLKATSDLAEVRTMGFVSHVQTDMIEAARRAGIDEVLARSAFSARLAEILRR